MESFIAAFRSYFSLWFHKRNIIIVSEHKVRHVPISGSMQFIAVAVLTCGVCWASYSTGCLMAARSALRDQTQALRSITGQRVETAFTTLAPAQPAMTLQDFAMDDGKASAAMSDSVMRFSAPDNVSLFNRVADLQKQVADLQTANASIIQRVRDKASDGIDDLESIIKKTGLNPSDLKRSYGTKPSASKSKRPQSRSLSEGGPFIPASVYDYSAEANEMFSNLDELALLKRIISDLPLASPMRGGDEQSSFGTRIDPFTKRLAFHSGLDFASAAGTAAHATANGKVIASGRNGEYGNAIDIEHGFGLVTRYGHLSQLLVKEGDIVKKGDIIGIQGSTGRSTGPHLHYEVRYNNKPLNPKNFIQAGRDAVSQ